MPLLLQPLQRRSRTDGDRKNGSERERETQGGRSERTEEQERGLQPVFLYRPFSQCLEASRDFCLRFSLLRSSERRFFSLPSFFAFCSLRLLSHTTLPCLLLPATTARRLQRMRTAVAAAPRGLRRLHTLPERTFTHREECERQCKPGTSFPRRVRQSPSRLPFSLLQQHE